MSDTTYIRKHVWALVFILCAFSTFTHATEFAPDRPLIRMVVTAAFVSDKGIPIYKELAQYLSRTLNWNVQVISGLSYEEADKMIENGTIQVGFVCGLPYINKSQQGSYELIATPVMAATKGQFDGALGYADIPGKYYSYTIVHKNSPLKSWADLKGKTYAFNEINSNSGYNMPRYKLIQLGAKSWQEYFPKVIISGTHEESIRLVAEGIVDASSVDSLVLDYDRYLGDENALNVRIIEHLHPGGAGAPPVVVAAKTPEYIKQALKDALLSMHENAEGRKILSQALVSRFIKTDDSHYDDIRGMVKRSHDVGFRDYDGY